MVELVVEEVAQVVLVIGLNHVEVGIYAGGGAAVDHFGNTFVFKHRAHHIQRRGIYFAAVAVVHRQLVDCELPEYFLRYFLRRHFGP